MNKPTAESKQIGVRFAAGDLDYLEKKSLEWKLNLSETIRRMVLVYRIQNGESM